MAPTRLEGATSVVADPASGRLRGSRRELLVWALKRVADVAPTELGIFCCDVGTTKMSHLRCWSGTGG